jgi:cell migration-inducing and hyaluronan-binding protein
VNGWQRSVMTANNGKYYIDTTVSKATQLGSPDLVRPDAIRRLNVFAKGQKYYVYFVFAKKDTKQTYQFYVGGDTKVEGIKISPKGWPIKAGEITKWDMPWKASVTDGILTVEVDFNKVPKTDIDPGNTTTGASVLSETCKPASFCSRNTSTNACQCNESKLGVLASLDPRFKNVCTRICTEWAVKDLDCPADGCRGFSFTMPDGFGTAQDQYRRPKPGPFPTDDTTSPWNTIVFKPTTKNSGSDCQYDAKHVPGTTTPAENKCLVVE